MLRAARARLVRVRRRGRVFDMVPRSPNPAAVASLSTPGADMRGDVGAKTRRAAGQKKQGGGDASRASSGAGRVRGSAGDEERRVRAAEL